MCLELLPALRSASAALRPGVTHRCGLREDVLAAQVRAGEGGRHGDKEVEYGDDNGFNRANWREGEEALGKAGRARWGTSCHPADGACPRLPRLGYSNAPECFMPPEIFIRKNNRLLLDSSNTVVH